MARRRKASGAVPHEAGVEPDLPAGGALGKARRALLRGDFQAVRSEAQRELSGNASADAKSEAQRLLEATRPDPAALLTAFAVLAVIAFAAWTALLHHP